LYKIKAVKTKKRNPLIAALLSIITPGLGQVYNGQLEKGLFFYFAFILSPFLISFTGLQYEFYGLILSIALVIFFYLFIIGEALIVALKIKEIILKPYNKWYFYLLLIIVLNIGTSGITYKFTNGFNDNEVFNELMRIKAYKIPTGAMMPTLLTDENIMVNFKHFKTNEIKRRDIIIFKYPENPEKDFIKRIIAIEGDVIEQRDRTVYVNGKELTEPYVKHTDSTVRWGKNDPRDNFGALVVPKDKVFVMGDNRDQSYDSRYWGFVDVKDVKGKALYIYWSKDKSRIGTEIK
jgi:signal peptidase I